jgi:hypothetical protein
MARSSRIAGESKWADKYRDSDRSGIGERYRRKPSNVIHHSDQGTQYTSLADPTAERIEHDSEIQEAGSRSAAKFPSTRSGAGRAPRSRRVVMTPRRRLTPTIPAARISRAIRFLPTARPFGTQLGMNSRCTVGAARDGMDRVHSSEQPIIGDGACRREARTPSIVAGRRHAEHACHGGDGEEGLVRAHELEDPDGITAVSRANQAAAFAKISRSWRSRRFSRRRRDSSSRSALVAPS